MTTPDPIAALPPNLRLVEVLHGFCCDGWGHEDDDTDTRCYLAAQAVLALIDAHQCYDEAALAEALHRVTSHYERGVNPQTDVHRRFHEADAAAIIARLHEA